LAIFFFHKIETFYGPVYRPISLPVCLCRPQT
jgi:hypothetical protein